MNVPFQEILELKDKIEKSAGRGISLTASEVYVLNQVMQAAEGKVFPSQDELDRQEYNVNLLYVIDPKDYRWARIMEECNEFESKYY